MLTGSKVMAHYVDLFIFDDLDLDLWPIFTKLVECRVILDTHEL